MGNYSTPCVYENNARGICRHALQYQGMLYKDYTSDPFLTSLSIPDVILRAMQLFRLLFGRFLPESLARYFSYLGSIVG